MNTHINDILSKELSRRDFLKLVAGSLVIAIGFNNFIHYLMNLNRPVIESKKEPTSHGFGASKFGR